MENAWLEVLALRQYILARNLIWPLLRPRVIWKIWLIRKLLNYLSLYKHVKVHQELLWLPLSLAGAASVPLQELFKLHLFLHLNLRQLHFIAGLAVTLRDWWLFVWIFCLLMAGLGCLQILFCLLMTHGYDLLIHLQFHWLLRELHVRASVMGLPIFELSRDTPIFGLLAAPFWLYWVRRWWNRLPFCQSNFDWESLRYWPFRIPKSIAFPSRAWQRIAQSGHCDLHQRLRWWQTRRWSGGANRFDPDLPFLKWLHRRCWKHWSVLSECPNLMHTHLAPNLVPNLAWFVFWFLVEPMYEDRTCLLLRAI